MSIRDPIAKDGDNGGGQSADHDHRFIMQKTRSAKKGILLPTDVLIMHLIPLLCGKFSLLIYKLYFFFQR